ncbi:hypothetical protein MDOR_11690 [Mycolicibacterium doricum]|uniref:Uncharacterized protein n=1 Tax=Mycolicibacterium doricum TaxID=126673 RepID=A0A7I7VPQ6_9MYCO|nr:hypothetical protein MDOR_11690 [Mycolicibacterium doricum]
MVADAVRPARPDGHGAAWEQLLGFEEQIKVWVAGDGEQRPLTITKIETLLARQGCVVPYRTLHRFASERCGFGRRAPRCGSLMVIRGWNARSISAIWGCSPMLLMGGAARCTR